MEGEEMTRRILPLAALIVAVAGCAAAPRQQAWSSGVADVSPIPQAPALHAAPAPAANAQRSAVSPGSASLANIPDTPPTDTSNAPGLAYSLGDDDCYLQRGSDGVVRGRVTMAMPGGGVGPRLLAKMINATLGTELDIDIKSAEVGGQALLTTSGSGRILVRGHPTTAPDPRDDGSGGAVADDHPLLTTPFLITIKQRDARPRASAARRSARPTADEYIASVRGDYPVPRPGPDARRLTAQQAKLWVNLIAYAISVSGRGLVHMSAESDPRGPDAKAPGYLGTLKTTPDVPAR